MTPVIKLIFDDGTEQSLRLLGRARGGYYVQDEKGDLGVVVISLPEIQPGITIPEQLSEEMPATICPARLLTPPVRPTRRQAAALWEFHDSTDPRAFTDFTSLRRAYAEFAAARGLRDPRVEPWEIVYGEAL